MHDILGLRKSSRACLPPGKLADFKAWTLKKRNEPQPVDSIKIQQSVDAVTDQQPVAVDNIDVQQPVDTVEVQQSVDNVEVQQPVADDILEVQQPADTVEVPQSADTVAVQQPIIIDPSELMPGDAMIISIYEHGVVSTSVVADKVLSSDDIVVEVERDEQVPGTNDATRGRKRVRDENNWKRNVTKRLRQQGREYRIIERRPTERRCYFVIR